MEIPKQLIECLDENKVSYEVLHHPEAVTAQRIAQAAYQLLYLLYQSLVFGSLSWRTIAPRHQTFAHRGNS